MSTFGASKKWKYLQYLLNFFRPLVKANCPHPHHGTRIKLSVVCFSPPDGWGYYLHYQDNYPALELSSSPVVCFPPLLMTGGWGRSQCSRFHCTHILLPILTSSHLQIVCANANACITCIPIYSHKYTNTRSLDCNAVTRRKHFDDFNL